MGSLSPRGSSVIAQARGMHGACVVGGGVEGVRSADISVRSEMPRRDSATVPYLAGM